MTNWYAWPTEDDFDAWHTSAKAALGIPYPGVNQATGEVDESAQWTTAYTDVIEVVADDWRAYVEADVAALVPDGLGTPCDPPPSPEVDG
jgi:hypothetical protein